jgi:hypothetical protein
MSELLRVYDPAECDEHGVPLDWERCRTCSGSGVFPRGSSPRTSPACHDGHGSLRAAVRRALVRGVAVRGPAHGGNAALVTDEQTRCKDCGHPMSDGTWEGPAAELLLDPEHPFTAADAEREWLEMQAWKREPEGQRVRHNVNYWSACDEDCRHGAPFQVYNQDTLIANITASYPGGAADHARQGGAVRASWRVVDVRPRGWAHDLRPERLAVLCSRCLAGERL